MAIPQAVQWDYLTDDTAWFLTAPAQQQTVTWRNDVTAPGLTLANLQQAYDNIVTNGVVRHGNPQVDMEQIYRRYMTGLFPEEQVNKFLTKKVPLKSFGEMLKEGVKNG